MALFLDGATFLAAHNAAFDKGVLRACCAAYGVAAPTLPFRCTVQMPAAPGTFIRRSCPTSAAKLNIALNHHEALSDATACAEIVLAAADLA